jgi:hypothetical protein
MGIEENNDWYKNSVRSYQKHLFSAEQKLFEPWTKCFESDFAEGMIIQFGSHNFHCSSHTNDSVFRKSSFYEYTALTERFIRGICSQVYCYVSQ